MNTIGRRERVGPDGAVEVLYDAGGAAVALRDVERFLTRFLVLPPKATLPVALWSIATFLFESFDAFPYLAISSPLPECGKTRLLEVLELIVSYPRRASNISEAALFRAIEKFKPTLMIDEAETLREKSEKASALRQLINAGNRSGSVATRVIGQGANLDVKDFSVYCPKVVCGIGSFPATIASRSISIGMQRRNKKRDPIERFLVRRVAPEGKALSDRMRDFAVGQRQDIELAYQKMALDFLGDRDADSWAPLFALLAVADPTRLPELEECAGVLAGAKSADLVDESLKLRLLSDIRDVWPDSEPHIFSKTLVKRLHSIEDGPWAETSLNERKLSWMLRDFHVRQDGDKGIVRIGNEVAKGYSRDDFDRASSPYLEKEPLQASHPNVYAGSSHFSDALQNPAVTSAESAKSPMFMRPVTDVTVKKPPRGDGGAGPAPRPVECPTCGQILESHLALSKHYRVCGSNGRAE
jgi:Protein of unknown function (DUF3631)